jgi:hypothetical protein
VPYKKSYDIFRFVVSSSIFILSEEQQNIFEKPSSAEIKLFDLFDWTQSPEKWFSNKQYDINSWLFWLLEKTHPKNELLPRDYLKKLLSLIDFSKNNFIALIQPFPIYSLISSIFQNNLEKIFEMSDSINNEGWFYSLIQSDTKQIDKIQYTAKLGQRFPNLINNINNKKDGYITLYDWIQWTQNTLFVEAHNSEGNIESFFDPRLSEWTALEIVRQICQCLKVKATDFFDSIEFDFNKPVHPANFWISIKWKDERSYSWSEWSKIIHDFPLKLRDSAQCIRDDRYTSKGLSLDYQNSTISLVHGVAIVLLELITHDTSFPWVWNITDRNLIMNGAISDKIQNSNISSYTNLILQSCFSSRNRESQFWVNKKITIEGLTNILNDTNNDSPLIMGINDMLLYILKAQQHLEDYQISVQNNMPRQLIPINLLHLSNRNNPFTLSENN